MDRIKDKRTVFICLFLSVGTLACYWPVLQSGFINLDDPQYVTHNSRVMSGLSWKDAQWAFHTHHASNWHPITWLSHQLDVQLFGLEPRWHHLTNLLLHIINSVLLFLLLQTIT